MTALGANLLEFLACLGWGGLVLRLLGLRGRYGNAEFVATAFAIGFGLLGWLVFFAGISGALQPLPLLLLLVAGLAGLPSFSGMKATLRFDFDNWEKAILAGLAASALLGIFQGLTPPTDADSVAYHFALPRQFLAAGRFEFVPRAADGAIPLLIHATYIPVLGLGGEMGLTLWTILSGWGAVVLTFALARRFLARRWALAVALLFASTPTVVYSMGTGQVETRMALFVLVAAFAVADAARTGEYRYAILAGLAAGFLAGAKYSGLLTLAAVGLVIVFRRQWLAFGLVFGTTALATGFQWYLWNGLHSGDPFFPMLFGRLPYLEPGLWDAEHQAMMGRNLFEHERTLPIDPVSLLTYPFIATLGGGRVLDSLRTGLGPFGLLVLPFVLAAALRFRRRLTASPLWPVAILLLVSYLLWFVSGFSQRIRHLLPLYPVFLIVVTAAATRWTAATGRSAPLVAAVAAVLAIQAAGQAIYFRGFVGHVASGESREAYLARTVTSFEAVRWINGHLGPGDKVYTWQRWLIYLIDVPVHYGHHAQDALVDIRPEAEDPARMIRQMKRLGITHILDVVEKGSPEDPAGPRNGMGQWRSLIPSGCLTTLAAFDTWFITSRTLGSKASEPLESRVLKINYDRCPR